MNNKTFRVLLIEDSLSDATLAREALNKSLVPSFLLTHVMCLDDGLEKLLHENFDLVVLDLALPDSHGLETFFTVRDHAPKVPIVILTGLVGDGLALRAFQEGAADACPKAIYSTANCPAVFITPSNGRAWNRRDREWRRSAPITRAALPTLCL